MAISELDIKILWGRSAGRCAWCNSDLLPGLSKAAQGDMAHIIASSTNGPRGSKEAAICDLNKYENLILLCPNHHRAIDSDPNSYTVEQIQEKKRMHEENTRSALEGEHFTTTSELFNYALKLLDENKCILDQFGPASPVAVRNPASEAKKLWDIRKIARMIPNNSKIVAAFEKNTKLLSNTQGITFNKFREHAIAFENNSYERLDNEAVPIFPIEFRAMLAGGV